MCGYSVRQANEIEIFGWMLALVHHIFVPNHCHFEFITNPGMSSCACGAGVLHAGLHATSCLLIYIDQKFVKRVCEKSRSCIMCFTSKTFRQEPRLSNNMYSLHCWRKDHHWDTAITDTALLVLLSALTTSKYSGRLHVVAFSKNK